MSDPPEIDLDPAERELASQLAAERPLPAPEFRGALGRHLTRRDPGYGPRPAHLRPLVTLYVGVGGLVATLGALQATGVL